MTTPTSSHSTRRQPSIAARVGESLWRHSASQSRPCRPMAITFVWTRFPFDQQFRSDVWWSTVAGCALRSKKLLLGSPPNVRGWSSPDRLQATRRRSVTQTLQVQGHPGGRRGWGFFSGTHLGPLSSHGNDLEGAALFHTRADEGYEGHLPSSNGNLVGVQCQDNFTRCMKNLRMIFVSSVA